MKQPVEEPVFAYDQCREYLRCVNKQDLDGVVKLFTDDAWVAVPSSKILPVRDFHAGLFQRAGRSVARLTNVFSSLLETNATALQFHYTWVFGDGRVVEFDGMSVFEISERSSLIRRLTIMYDPTILGKELSPRAPSVQVASQVGRSGSVTSCR